MENQITKEESPLEISHGFVHEICFNLGKGDLNKAREQLRELDVFLHDSIHLECLNKT